MKGENKMPRINIFGAGQRYNFRPRAEAAVQGVRGEAQGAQRGEGEGAQGARDRAQEAAARDRGDQLRV